MNNYTQPYQQLIELCDNTEINSNVKDVHEMLGFICAISSSPESLELQEWLPHLWKQGVSPTFSQQQLAVDFASAVIQFYDACIAQYQQATALLLPTEQWLDEYSQITGQGINFAIGYLSGFHHVEQCWDSVNIESGSEFEQILQTTTLLLSKVAAPNTDDPQMQDLFNQLPQFNEIAASLPLLISTLGFLALQVKAHEE